MKKIIIFALYTICLISTSCKQSLPFDKNDKQKNLSPVNIKEAVYSEALDSIKIESDLSENDKIKKIKISSPTTTFLIQIIDERAYLNIGAINEKEISSWQIINFNFIYETSLNDAVKDIHLLVSENPTSGYLMFPATTEQYSTYYLYKFSQSLLEYIGIYEDDSFGSFKGKFKYNEIQHDLYIQNNDHAIRRLKLLTIQSDKIPANIIEREKKIITGQIEQTYPSNLKGYWQTGCGNKFTELSVNNSEGYLSLNSFNAIYINLKVEKLSKENEYILKYAGIGSQSNYYEDAPKLIEGEISKDKIIGRMVIQKNGKALLNWIGLYNNQKKKVEFIGDDFSLIKEGGHKNPVLLEKCD